MAVARSLLAPSLLDGAWQRCSPVTGAAEHAGHRRAAPFRSNHHTRPALTERWHQTEQQRRGRQPGRPSETQPRRCRWPGHCCRQTRCRRGRHRQQKTQQQWPSACGLQGWGDGGQRKGKQGTEGACGALEAFGSSGGTAKWVHQQARAPVAGSGSLQAVLPGSSARIHSLYHDAVC